MSETESFKLLEKRINDLEAKMNVSSKPPKAPEAPHGGGGESKPAAAHGAPHG